LWLKSKRVLSGSTSEPFCCHVRTQHFAQRLVHQVGGRVVADGARALGFVDLRIDRVAHLQRTGRSTPWWPNTSAWIFSVSSTSNAPAPVDDARSPTWPPDSA
jgi:hypothetical protein